MFEKTIEPILLYRAEIWGADNTAIIERYHLKVIKQILGLSPSTPTYMILGEIGKLPLRHTIEKLMLKFWYRLVAGKQEKISHQIYKIMISDKISTGVSFKWLDCIEKILNGTGNAHLWLHQNMSLTQSKMVVRTLQDMQIQNLFSNRESSTKARTYLYLKDKWEMEFYIKNLDTHPQSKFYASEHVTTNFQLK